MKTALVVPDGVGIRNFILGGAIDRLREAGPITVFHGVPEESMALYGVHEGVTFHYMGDHREDTSSIFLRYCLAYSHMYFVDTMAMRYNRVTLPQGSWRMRLMHRTTRQVGRFLGRRTGVLWLQSLHTHAAEREGKVKEAEAWLRRDRPDVLLCSHQRPPIIIPVVLAAKQLGIPTACFIFSWDNLTSKGRIAAPFDYYLVWSKLMRNELLRYYPDVSEERVRVVGTPQFDPYVDSEMLWDRGEFFRRVGADPNRPLICYSGGDRGTCPEDPEHLAVLMEGIESGQIAGRPQVIVRANPVDDPMRYDNVRSRFPEMIFAQPAWLKSSSGHWAGVLPTEADVQFLANLTHHCDLNVNMASTMTLDFAIHDKPVVNIAFDVASPPPHGSPLWGYFYRFEHYRPVVELGAARFARSREELWNLVSTYLADPSLDREGRRKLVELEAGPQIGGALARITKALISIANSTR
jgi:hypothetical protein